jgi:hypothetical protein
LGFLKIGVILNSFALQEAKSVCQAANIQGMGGKG